MSIFVHNCKIRDDRYEHTPLILIQTNVNDFALSDFDDEANVERLVVEVDVKVPSPEGEKEDNVSVEKNVKKFSIKDETLKLANGMLACRHCDKQFKVVAQAYRHFKEAHSKVNFQEVLTVSPVEIKKFSVKDETTKLPNGMLACRHCTKQFKVVAQAYRHFKDSHSKTTCQEVKVVSPVKSKIKKVLKVKEDNVKVLEVKREEIVVNIDDDVTGVACSEDSYSELIDEEFLKPEVNLVFDGDSDNEVSEGSSNPGTTRSEVVQFQNGCHVCTFCKKKFKSLSLAYQHVEETHQIVLEFTCPFCEAAFETNDDLILHKRKIHRIPKGIFKDLILKEDDRDQYKQNFFAVTF